jgi:hypothetical protein
MAEEIKARAREIAADARDVRARTRELVLDVIKSGSQAVGRFPAAVDRVIEGAREGLNEVADERRAEVLREVMDGLSDGLGRGASAVKLSLEEARGRGQNFAADEVRATVADLKAIESLLVERLTRLVKNSAAVSGEQARDLLVHAQRAAQGMRPAIASAIEAAEKNPVTLAKDTASVAAGAGRRAVGSLFQAVAGVLDGVGEAIGGKREQKKDCEP